MSELPPLEQPQAYVVVGPNDQRGPYTLDLLIGEVVAGRLHDATPVWWPGLAEWTTMNAHPGVAAEIARRRVGEAMPAPAPAPADPQYAVPPAAAQPEPAPLQPEPAPDAYARPEPAPLQPEPAPIQAGPTPGTFDIGQQPAQAPVAPGAFDVGHQLAAPADQWVDQVQEAPAVDSGPDLSSAQTGWTVTDTSQVSESTHDIVEAEVVDGAPTGAPSAAYPSADPGTPAVGAPIAEAPAAAAPGSAVTEEHRNLFQRLVERSRHRTHAGDRVGDIDRSLVDAVLSGAESQGFTSTDRTDGDANHELRFDGGPGETLSITLGRIKGDDPEKVRAGHVPISVRFQSATYAGGLETGSGEHGEVVIVSDEWSGQATSTVSLLLTLEDYVDARYEVDAVSVLRDVGATVSVVSGRMR